MATNGEFLQCRNNVHDPFAIAVLTDSIIIGHIPKKISTVCSLFLRRSGSIVCQVNGSRRYSNDLPQGGREIPCKLIFTGNSASIDKLRKEIVIVNSMSPKKVNEMVNVDEEDEKDGKRTKFDCEIEWVRVESIILNISDKATIQGGQQLNDMHLNASQKLQFPSFKGFDSTLGQSCVGKWIDNYINIFHSCGNHWICVSTIRGKHEEINIYDSLYKDYHKED